MKKIIYLTIMINIFIVGNLYSQYWKEVTTIPAPYNANYWLEIFISPSNPNNVWICGFNGFVIRTTDGGSSWRGSKVPNADHLESINFPTTQIGYVSGVEGIFKTTDGGDTWNEITSPTSTGSWGCSFVNENYGIYVGDGCAANSNQDFWLTTNGGTNWGLFNGNELNSGLTDVWLSSIDGLGYAVSSGMIWLTTDGGQNWSPKIPTGTKVWHEELAVLGSSFLVPVAGNDCSGAGAGGGMRFSTNNGSSWELYSTFGKLYGAALISATEGWAVGESNSVYFTNDAGKSWNLYNCGIKPGRHLDDIQFIDRNNAWLVGQGVYKLNPTEHPFSKSLIEFNNTCVGTTKRDTLYIKNLSFFPTELEISFSGLHPNFFKLVAPNQWHTMQPCDSVEIIIEFTATANIDRFADLDVRFYPNDPTKTKILSLNLVGQGIQSTASPEALSLVLDPAPVGIKTIVAQKWSTKGNTEEITGYQKLIYNDEINLTTSMPKVIWANGSDLEFEIFPQDTGWTETKYRFSLQPCDKDTTIIIRAYGTSPIIQTSNKFEINADCGKDKIDTIYIHNTGNATLRIDKAEFIEPNSPVEIIGWASNETAPIFVNRGSFKMLIIRYNKNLGAGKFNLKITNNDSTKARGIKNPYIIEVNATQNYSEFDSPVIVDFGRICLNQTKTIPVTAINIGTMNGLIQKSDFTSDNFELIISNVYPILVKPNENFNFDIKFVSKEIGFIEEKLRFPILPCNDTLEFIVRAFGVSGKLELNPNSVEVFTRKDKPENVVVRASSAGNSDIDIKKIYLNPPSTDWTMSFTPILNVVMETGSFVDFTFTFTPSSDTDYKGKLCFEYDGECPGIECIDINLSSKARFVSADKDTVGSISSCYKIPQLLEFNLINYVVLADTIVNYKLIGDKSFKWKNPFTLPKALIYNKPEKIIIEFIPETYGRFEGAIEFETFSPESQIITVHFICEFTSVESSPETTEIDFGDIELCQGSVTKSLKINSVGNLPDYFNITKLDNENMFAYLGNNPLIISANSSETVEFSLTIPNDAPLGNYTSSYKFLSTICADEFVINLKANIVKPTLTINPKTLDFTSVWKDDNKELTFDIKNESNVNCNLTSINFDNDLFNQISFSPQLPINVQANSSNFVKVKFTAKNVGKFSSNVKLIYESKCIDSLNANIVAEVPEETYQAKLKFLHYQTKPGTVISIPLILENGIERFSTDLIKYVFSFDKHLFFPKKLFVNYNGKFEQTELNYANGIISGEIVGDTARKLLGNAGEIMKIEGVTLVYVPDSTALEITEFNLNTDKIVNLIKQSGSIKLVDYCVPSGALNRLLRYSYADMKISNSTNDIKIDLVSDGNLIKGKLKLFSLLGIEIFNKDVVITNITSEYHISKTNVSSGIYIINLTTENNQIISQQILIEK